jgi:hypothetical protein
MMYQTTFMGTSKNYTTQGILHQNLASILHGRKTNLTKQSILLGENQMQAPGWQHPYFFFKNLNISLTAGLSLVQ